ncbi:MAG: autotransporter-associated beta strand repeat-containing protein, partial [Kiritimatiellaeota bacterium]|nr:autotransporter-associated beta strand repeat-containing protein [Kiritimatiellota bacterium]
MKTSILSLRLMLAVVTLLALGTAVQGQTYRRWDGSASTAYNDANNWTAADVPNSNSKAIDVDGDNGTRTRIRFNITAGTTVGQLRIISPATTALLHGDYNLGTSGNRTLYLSPSASFGGVGLDMSAATVDFSVRSWNATRYMILALAENQQWNVNSGSASGNLIFLKQEQDSGNYQRVNLQGYALTANVGSGRTIDATYGLFQGTGGSIILTGAGTLKLGQANTYTGATTVSGGLLTLGNASALQYSALDTLNSSAGTATDGLKTTVTTLTLGGLTGDKDLASVFTTTSGGYGSVTALTLNPQSGNASYSGAIANGAAGMKLTKSGAGTQILSGTNTYTGVTAINAGTLQLGAGGTSGALSASSAITNNSVLVFNRSDALIQGAHFSSSAISGTGALVQNGPGTLTLNAANTYTGGTTISNGTLSVEVTANLGAAASGLTFNGGTLQITGTTLANFSGIGHTVAFTAAQGVGLDINNAAHTFTVDQALNQTSGGFTKLGAGTAILDQANTYTGGTTISAGTLQLGAGGTSGALSASSAITNNSVLVFNHSDAMTQGVHFSSSAISGTGALVQNGSGTLTLNAANTYTGVTTLNAGVLEATTLAHGGTASSIGQSSSAAANLLLGNGTTLKYTGGAAGTDRA